MSERGTVPFQQKAVVTAFDREALALHRRVSCRRLVTEEEIAEAVEMRRNAYLRSGGPGLSEPEAAGAVASDGFDSRGGAVTVGVFHEGRMAASVRVHPVRGAGPDTPAARTAASVYGEWAASGQTAIETSRMVQAPGLPPELRLMPYVTIRVAAMAAVHWRADRALHLVLPRHLPFYEKAVWSNLAGWARLEQDGARPVAVAIAVTDVAEGKKKAFRQACHLLSTPDEREALFAPSSAPGDVSPTAWRVCNGEPAGF